MPPIPKRHQKISDTTITDSSIVIITSVGNNETKVLELSPTTVFENTIESDISPKTTISSSILDKPVDLAITSIASAIPSVIIVIPTGSDIPIVSPITEKPVESNVPAISSPIPIVSQEIESTPIVAVSLSIIEPTPISLAKFPEPKSSNIQTMPTQLRHSKVLAFPTQPNPLFASTATFSAVSPISTSRIDTNTNGGSDLFALEQMNLNYRVTLITCATILVLALFVFVPVIISAARRRKSRRNNRLNEDSIVVGYLETSSWSPPRLSRRL